ncbi:hypothetical protein BIU88_07175 [Chlorobaculum limnaeum]|uniref:Pyrrolo-quinoline quinone n=1 Tax=Chlorobaculum limnaeum TaxID=274537 RepID=A0A1D8D6Y3_CHLLM|nr:hypothetical protein [Chlorobaculum limnaeum]AOS83948.1 hypothetical protein BIU88_07175 [Chlorobaculum limnaeum]
MRNFILRPNAIWPLFAAVLCLLLLLPAEVPARMAERMADPVGKTDSFFSDNGVWEVAITYGNPFASWSLKKHGKEIWSDPLMTGPGGAAVSDNGELITLPLWGWRDEGGSSGIALYNGQGKALRQIVFRNDGGSESLRWVCRTAISPEGARIAIGENGRDGSWITLFDAAEGRRLWSAKAGLPEIDYLCVSVNGDYTLAATSKYGTGNMAFVLIDKQGKTIWSEKRSGNLSWEVKAYGRFLFDGSGFEIYDLKSKSFMKRRFPAPKR